MKIARSNGRPLMLGVLSGLAMLGLAACASEAPAPPPPPLPVLPVPTAAPAPPPVALSRPVLEAAGAYRIYIRRAAAVTPAFASGQAVEQSLASAAAYEPKQFLSGLIAYSALVALQDPNFVAGVRTYAVDPVQRRMLADRLVADPAYAAALPSAGSAAGLIVAALDADGMKVKQAGDLMKQAAYDVQHQAWSKGEVAGRDARLAQVKTEATQPIVTPESDTDALGKAVVGGDAAKTAQLTVLPGAPLAAPFSPIVDRGLALAAVAALGEGGDENNAKLQGLFDESGGGFCLNMAKLNLYQCLSVAKPYYEDVFCLGQHILADTGQCVTKAAGNSAPVAAPAPTPVAAAASPVNTAAAQSAAAPAR